MLSSNDDLVNYLRTNGALKTPRIIKAFKAIDRAEFVPSLLQSSAYTDQPLPIGLGQTISQPSTVAFMLELLQPQSNDRVMEIGAGSGYVAALLSYITGARGVVIAVERHHELTTKAASNLESYNFDHLKLISADGSVGMPGYAPYDRIIISAAAPELPQAIVAQLAKNSRLVCPVGRGLQNMVLLVCQQQRIIKRIYPGFVFVPLIKN